MKRLQGLAYILALTALAPPGAAEPAPTSDIAAFQQLDQRLFAVGWRLARGNARFCAEAPPTMGLLLHDTTTYGDPMAIRRALALAGDIGVAAVAPGSPAALAGIAANDTLLSIGGVEIAAFPPSDPSWQRTLSLNEAIGRALESGPVDLTLSRPGAPPYQAVIAGEPVCATRFEVLDSSSKAQADGSRVIIGQRFPAFAWPEDEFAAAVAHELAHNLLGHRAIFDRTGRKQKLVRLSERDADRLAPWLLQNAGYDSQAAVRFMRKWGPKHGGGLIRKRTHDGWDERVEFIEAEIATMQPLIAADGSADWARHFRPELAAAASE